MSASLVPSRQCATGALVWIRALCRGPDPAIDIEWGLGLESNEPLEAASVQFELDSHVMHCPFPAAAAQRSMLPTHTAVSEPQTFCLIAAEPD